MEFQIFHTINCGLYLYCGNTGILVDGLHGSGQCFSEMPDIIRSQLANKTGLFAHLDALLFTHCHKDHFLAEALPPLAEAPQPPAYWWPGVGPEGIPMDDEMPELRTAQIGAVRVYALDTKHDGGPDMDIPHCSYLLEGAFESVLISGDAVFSNRTVDLLTRFKPVTAGFFNIYQITSVSGRRLIEQLGVKNIWVYHLPFPEDDVQNYIPLTKRLARRFPPHLPKPMLITPLTWLNGDAPGWKKAKGGVTT